MTTLTHLTPSIESTSSLVVVIDPVESHGSADIVITNAFVLTALGSEHAPDGADIRIDSPFVLTAQGGGQARVTFALALEAHGYETIIGRANLLIGVYGDDSGASAKWRLTANGLTGAIGGVDVTLNRPFQLTAQGGGGASLTFAMAVNAEGTTGIVGSATLTFSLALEAHGYDESIGRANLEVGPFVSVWGIFDHAISFRVEASGHAEVTPVRRAYAINARTGELTEYTNFAFDFLVRFQGEAYLFAATEAFKMGGTLDDEDEIDARFEIAPTEFGTSMLKRVPYVYLGVKSGRALSVTTKVDGTRQVAARTLSNGRNRRARMARGVKGRFWSAEVANRDGEAFAIDSLEMLPNVLQRKV